MPRAGNTTARGYGSRYQHARAALLADGPPCHWCALRGIIVPATTADHEPPIHEVGHPHLQLVPACGPCNYGRSHQTKPFQPSRAW